MIVIQLRGRVREEMLDGAIGKFADESHYDAVISGDAKVYKPDGSPLLILKKNAVADDDWSAALPALRAAKKYKTNNRGLYAGGIRSPIKRLDGTYSRNIYAVDPATLQKLNIPSTIAGYSDRTSRTPYCRETSFTAKETEAWSDLCRFSRRIAEAYEQLSPDRYAVQERFANSIRPEWRIAGTPFTTLTINQTIRGAIHRDAGDFKDGMGVITVHRSGAWTGHYLCFPAFRVAVDLGNRDVLLFDPHEMHGNTEMTGDKTDAERISVVYYARSKMQECGSPADELAHAKRARGGLIDNDDDGGDE